MPFKKIFYLLFLTITLFACSKKEPEYIPTQKVDPYLLYEEAYDAFEKGDYFFASKFLKQD